MALFAFSQADVSQETPEFVAATLLEIAGPGLLLRAPIQTKTGDRVLVAVRLGTRRVVQGLAKVRRASHDRTGKSLLAVELVGLDSDEVAELVRETNLASARLKTASPAEAPAEVSNETQAVTVS